VQLRNNSSKLKHDTLYFSIFTNLFRANPVNWYLTTIWKLTRGGLMMLLYIADASVLTTFNECVINEQDSDYVD